MRAVARLAPCLCRGRRSSLALRQLQPAPPAQPSCILSAVLHSIRAAHFAAGARPCLPASHRQLAAALRAGRDAESGDANTAPMVARWRRRSDACAEGVKQPGSEASSSGALPEGAPATPPEGQQLTDIGGERFRKRERLSGNAAFLRVQRVGRSFKLEHMRLQVASNADVVGATCTRIGVITAKKSLRRAVDRNLVRRRIRDIFRKNKATWPQRVDIVLVMASSALEVPYSTLERDLMAWAATYAAPVSKPAVKPRRSEDVATGSGSRLKKSVPSLAKPVPPPAVGAAAPVAGTSGAVAEAAQLDSGTPRVYKSGGARRAVP